MDGESLRALQAPLKEQYRDAPDSAVITLTAEGDIDDAGIACKVADRACARDRGPAPGNRRQRPRGLLGRHAAGGARGLRGRHAQGSRDAPSASSWPPRTCAPRAISTSAARCGVDREAPVGFRDIRLTFELSSDAPQEQLDQLLKLTERYCVVLQTLRAAPPASASLTLV